MPQTNWQAERAKTRQPRAPRLVVLPETPCAVCGHVRTSHAAHTLRGGCRFPACDCRYFEPRCGCGHLLASHEWGTFPYYWACAQCECRQFGALLDEKAATDVVAVPLRLF